LNPNKKIEIENPVIETEETIINNKYKSLYIENIDIYRSKCKLFLDEKINSCNILLKDIKKKRKNVL